MRSCCSSTDEICAAIQDVFEDTRSIVEPAGALAVAGLKKYVARDGWHGKRLVAINSGANMNFDRLRHVAERADLGGEREALLAVVIPEQPGSFLHFCEALGRRSVTEFNYRYAGRGQRADLRRTSPRAHGRAEKEAVGAGAARGGLHRHRHDAMTRWPSCTCATWSAAMHAASPTRLLYRFEFPERPGALLKFLQAIGSRWNISLFHYRNHGSDYGRVLAGIQVPAARAAGLPAAPERAALRLRGGDRQPRLPHVSRRLRRRVRRAARASAVRAVAAAPRAATRARSPAAPRGSPGR